MKYIIMCGGDYSDQFETPKPLLEINGERLVERTIRLLKENGITDIGISTLNPKYDYLGIEILRHKNEYIHEARDLPKKSEHCWLNAYYPTEEPACYLAGDVYWSNEAIKKVIETEVEDTMFFAAPGIMDGRKHRNIKNHREPLGFKVVNQKHFRNSINALKDMIDKGIFSVDPVSWTLYKYLNNLEINYHDWNNDIFDKPGNLVAIDDITTDIDSAKDIPKLEEMLRYEKLLKGGTGMVRLEALECFNLNETMFKELKEVVRATAENNEPNKLYLKDTFLCNEKIAKYLINEADKEGKPGNNPADRPLAKVLEVIPDKKEITIEEEAPELDKILKKVVEETNKGLAEINRITKEATEKSKELKPKRTRKKKE